MIDFTLETHIARTPAEVFDYASDPARLATWQTNTVSSVADGPLQVGTRLREVHRAPGGKQLESLVEIAEFERGKAFALNVIEGTPVHLRMTFEPDDGGTRVRFRVHGSAMRLLQPVLKRQFRSQLNTLKTVMA
jgi:uncharacterized protein YndB with AHSA1/START domain